MEVNKVTFGGKTLIDLTEDTVTENTLAKGFIAHNAKGERIVGRMTAEGGGSGSGIIDVTELPTSGIDENAVYRLSESIKSIDTNAWVYINSEIETISAFMAGMGIPTVPNIYEVDELPSDMKGSDVTTFTAIHLYILRTDGKCYLYVPEYGMTMTLAIMFFQDPAYDKGATDNPYVESEKGIYTTFEKYEDVVRYFIRENGEWKEITAYTNAINEYKLYVPSFLSGDVTSSVLAVNDVVTAESTEISESWFKKRDGSYCDWIRPFLFSNFPFINVTIPSCVRWVEHDAFFDCYDLTTVTFKGIPYVYGVNSSAFSYCDNLKTINVPWSEGYIENAPWGATNATINYNYTEG